MTLLWNSKPSGKLSADGYADDLAGEERAVKRRRLILLAVLAAFGLATVAWLAMLPRSAICKANYERIREGMTLSEVEDILGGPPRNESTGTLMALAVEANVVTMDGKQYTQDDLASSTAYSFQEGVIGPPLDYKHSEHVADGFPHSWPIDNFQVWVSNVAIIRTLSDDKRRVTKVELLPVYRKYDGLWPTLRAWLRI